MESSIKNINKAVLSIIQCYPVYKRKKKKNYRYMQDRNCHNVKYNYILRKPKKFNSIINEFRSVANF